MSDAPPKKPRLSAGAMQASRLVVLVACGLGILLTSAAMLLAAEYPLVSLPAYGGRMLGITHGAILAAGGIMLAILLALGAALALLYRMFRQREGAAGKAQAAGEDAGAASRSRARFLSMMNHDVRTPMNGIIGMTELLLQTNLDEEQRRCANVVHDSGKSLLRMLDNILEFSRLEGGAARIAVAPFNPVRPLRDAMEHHAPDARAKGLALDFRPQGALPARLLGDGARIAQVLDCLLHNAIRFTDKGAITLTLRAEESPADPANVRLHYAVRDNGPGLGKDAAGALFPVAPAGVPGQVQAGQARPGQARAAGTGLGLEICRQLVNLMGGEIGVRSEVGEGAEFFFFVSCERDLTGAASSQPEHKAPAPLPPAAPASASSAAAVATDHAPKLLVAEDGEINRQLIQILLSQMGYTADYAHNGQEALDAVARTEYDLVLMDCVMPVMDGYEAARRIRMREAAHGERRLRIIALTANTLDGESDRCRAAGMDDYLPKPFTGEEFARRVNHWLARAGSLTRS